MNIEITSYLFGVASTISVAAIYLTLVFFKVRDVFPAKEITFIPWRFSLSHIKASSAKRLPLTTSPIRFKNIGFGTCLFLGTERTFFIIRLNEPRDEADIQAGMEEFIQGQRTRTLPVDP